MEDQVPDMVNKFKQGMHRLISNETDKGINRGFCNRTVLGVEDADE